MTKPQGIIYRPNPNKKDEALLYQYLMKEFGEVSCSILATTKTAHLPIALLSSENSMTELQMQAMKSVVDLSRQIDLIYTQYAVFGINLPGLSRNYGGGYIPVQSPQLDREPAVVKITPVDDEIDEDNSIDWDEPMIKAVKPLCNFDN
jgi:hypothetical protein